MKRNEVRQIDKIAIEQYGISGLVLMENAGRGAAERIADLLASLPGGDRFPVCILCGPGNNGGDGYVIARHLEIMGFTVRIVSLVKLGELTGDAKVNAEIAEKSKIPITIVTSPAELTNMIQDDQAIIDCMLGTGATGQPRGIYADAIEIANQKDGPRVAIDLPTGLDCDSGQPSKSTFRADLTVTFVAEKAGFLNEAAKPSLGKVEIVGIGVPNVLLSQFGV